MWLKISDPAEGPGAGTGGPPVTELSVLPRLHKVLAPAVIGVLVESPVAIHHIAGVDVMTVEMISHRITVIAELHHLALKVGASVDAEEVGAVTGLRTHRDINSSCCIKLITSKPQLPSKTHKKLWWCEIKFFYISYHHLFCVKCTQSISSVKYW